MKIPFALLALSASTVLFSNSCRDPCCRPVCVPEPRSPICCECYTPAFYDMQCDCGIFLTFDFLYWYAREDDLSYAAVGSTVSRAAVSFPRNATTPKSYKHLDAKWKPGGRIGLGLNSSCDGWDLYANWTHYKGEGKDSTSVSPFSTSFPSPGQKAVFPIWTDKVIFTNTAHENFALFNSISAKWKTRFNVIDLEMGRRYYLSECFTMRPYAGLRGAWTRTNFNVKGKETQIVNLPTTPATVFGTPNGLYAFNTRDFFRNRNWGVGILAGFQPVFYFTKGFSLYANADAALLWEKFRNTTKRRYSSVQNGSTTDIALSYSAHDEFTGVQPVIDLGLGFRWETYWCEKRYGLEFDAGWEHHVWFDHNYRVKALDSFNVADADSISGPPGGSLSIITEEISSNLAMGGFILRARFSF